MVATATRKLEVYGDWPELEAAVGPNWGVGDGVHIPPPPGVLEDVEVKIDVGNYGILGSVPNYKGIPKDVETGSTDVATARIRSINYDPLFLPALPDTRIPQWNVLPYGAWYQAHIPSVKKSAVFGAQTTVAQYGKPMNFKAPEVASIAGAAVFGG